MHNIEKLAPASSGIEELDFITGGGYPRNRLCLIQGPPGSGKTTLGLQFLLEGLKTGEKGAYISFSESEEELKQSAASHGWSLEGISIIEFGKNNSELAIDEQYTVLHPADVELAETSTALLSQIRELCPARLVLDSLSELRMIARDSLRYRRQILALKQVLTGEGCTLLFLGDETQDSGTNLLLQSVAHSVITLSADRAEHGGTHRRLQVTKMRGTKFIDGEHDFRIRTGGIHVYPRLVVDPDGSNHAGLREEPALNTGLAELDNLIGGPIPWRFGLLLAGPPGIGKSSLAAQFAWSAAKSGKNVCMFSFEENSTTLLQRCESLGIGLRDFVENKKISLCRLDPSRATPGEITHAISTCIEAENAGVVIIDSLNGYFQAMSNDRSLLAHLHELLGFLNQRGIITVLVSAQHGFLDADQSRFEATYLADLVILLRYFEAAGRVRQAISVVKNRSEAHERTIREFEVGKRGIRIGEPLREFQGVLTGVPEFTGGTSRLIHEKDDA